MTVDSTNWPGQLARLFNYLFMVGTMLILLNCWFLRAEVQMMWNCGGLTLHKAV